MSLEFIFRTRGFPDSLEDKDKILLLAVKTFKIHVCQMSELSMIYKLFACALLHHTKFSNQFNWGYHPKERFTELKGRKFRLFLVCLSKLTFLGTRYLKTFNCLSLEI